MVALAAAVLLVGSFLLRDREEMRRVLQPVHRNRYVEVGTLHVGAATVSVEFARDPDAWARGLSGRDTLPEESGMLFIFPAQEERTFWMKDTRIPLDLVWIRGGTVVGVTAHVPPEPGVANVLLRRYPSPGSVDRVLEVNAGWAAEHGVNVNDAVRLE